MQITVFKSIRFKSTIGWSSKGKYPVVLKRYDEKVYSYPAGVVLKALNRGTIVDSILSWTEENRAIPPEIKTELDRKDAFRSHHANIVDIRSKKDSSGQIVDWIVVMDDGGYYKHGAKYMIWSKNEGSKLYGQSVH